MLSVDPHAKKTLASISILFLCLACSAHSSVAVKCNLDYSKGGKVVPEQVIKEVIFVLDYSAKSVKVFDGDHLVAMVRPSFGEQTIKFSFPDYRNPTEPSADLPELLLDRQSLKINGKMIFKPVSITGVCKVTDLPNTKPQGKQI